MKSAATIRANFGMAPENQRLRRTIGARRKQRAAPSVCFKFGARASRIALWLLLVGALTGAVTLSADDSVKLKVLVIAGGHGFEQKPFFDIFRENPEITFTAAVQGQASATAYERPDLLNYDVVVLYDMSKTITDAQKAGFMAMFDKGIGLVVLHHALVSFQHWPEYERIIGGRYPEADGKSGVVTPEVGYQHDVEVPVEIVDRSHPITAGMKNFTIRDEIYWGFRTQPDVIALITTTQPKSGKPLGWCRAEGKSRVVYLQLGHGPSAYNDPNYRELVARSIRWAARKEIRN